MSLPGFEEYSNNVNETGNYYLKSVSPTSFDLDPYWYFMANDFNVVAKDERYNTFDLNIRKDAVKTYVRTVGIRGPIMYSGWGYDICGLPSPNISQNSLTFDSETSYNRAKWKSGPIDLRWDDKRKVWVGGPEVLEGTLLADLAAPSDIDHPTTAGGLIHRGINVALTNTVYGDQDQLLLTNRNPKLSLQQNDYFFAVKINYEWRPIGGGGASSSGNNEFLMILGTYENYKTCAGAPGPPPSMPDNQGGCGDQHYCGLYYAWASYKVCGYKYYKVRDYTTYGAWAAELGADSSSCEGAGSPDLYRFYPAIFSGDKGLPGNAGAGCDAGVRYIRYMSMGARPCSSPPSCYAGPTVFDPCDPCGSLGVSAGGGGGGGFGI